MKGHIVKRGEDTWSLVFDLGRGEDGKRKQKWVTVRGTKREAEKELARLLHEAHTGTFVEPSRMTLAEYLEYWLENYAQTKVSPKTFESYAEFIRLYIIPKLGQHKLAKLQVAHIQSYYTQMLTSGRLKRAGGLSAQSVLHQHRILRQALQQAVKWQFLGRNPADAVVAPRPDHREMRALTDRETAQLLKAAEGTRLYMPILLAITTGLRRGELLGLRWADMDLSTGVLSVRQSLGRTRSGMAFKPPKTAKSRRTVTLPAFVIEALERHRAVQNEERRLLGGAYQDQDLVAAEPDGQPQSPGALSRAFSKLIIAKRLPQVRFHDLRHSHATQLLKQGVHPKIVSERLGHSTIGLTLDTYSHVLPGMQEEAAKRVDTALRAALEKEGTDQP